MMALLTSQQAAFCVCSSFMEVLPMVLVSDALCNLTGYDREQLLGSPFHVFLGCDPDPLSVKMIQDAARQGAECSMPMLCQNSRGECYWTMLQLAPIKDVHGVATSVLIIQRETSPRPAVAETNNSETAAFFDKLFDPSTEEDKECDNDDNTISRISSFSFADNSSNSFKSNYSR